MTKKSSPQRVLMAAWFSEARYTKGVPADPTENMSKEDAEKWWDMNEEYGDLLKQARYPDGEHSDPTENMSEEDAAIWNEMNAEYGDLLKQAAKRKAYQDGNNTPWGYEPGQVTPQADYRNEGSQFPPARDRDGKGIALKAYPRLDIPGYTYHDMSKEFHSNPPGDATVPRVKNASLAQKPEVKAFLEALRRDNKAKQFVGKWLEEQSDVNPDPRSYHIKDILGDASILLDEVSSQTADRWDELDEKDMLHPNLNVLIADVLEGWFPPAKVEKIWDDADHQRRKDYKYDSRYASSLMHGDTLVSQNGAFRIHRYRGTVMVTELKNAGKRGKMCEVFAVYNADHAEADLSEVLSHVEAMPSFDAIKDKLLQFVDDMSHLGTWTPRVNSKFVKGVTVAPASLGKIVLDTPKLYVRAEPRDFSVTEKSSDKALMESNVTQAKSFYFWLLEHRDEVKQMSFDQLHAALRKSGISPEFYMRD